MGQIYSDGIVFVCPIYLSLHIGQVSFVVVVFTAQEAKNINPINIINNFFNADDYREKFGGKKAKIITAISMFYDLENPNKF